MSLTEDQIRKIVREEISEALKVLKKQSSDFPDYETDTIEDSAVYAMEKVIGNTLYTLECDPSCDRRSDKPYPRCTCGAHK